MKTTVMSFTVLSVTCLTFLFTHNTLSLGGTVEIADDAGSIRKLLGQPIWCEADPDRGGLWKQEKNDGYGDKTSLVLQDTVCNTDPPKWAYEIREKPQGDNQFRFLTFAWKKDAPGEALVLEFVGFPGFGCGHPNACWDHRLLAGPIRSVGGWVSHGFDQHAEEAPRNWTFNIVDLFEWGKDKMHAGTPVNGEWRIDGFGLDTDHPKRKGDAYLDAVHLTQSRREAEQIGGPQAVSPADKLTSIWGRIKADYE